MSRDQAWQVAGALTLAVAFGWHWAVHSRAQQDLEGVKTAMDRAKATARTAAISFGVVIVIAVIVAKVYINKNGG